MNKLFDSYIPGPANVPCFGDAWNKTTNFNIGSLFMMKLFHTWSLLKSMLLWYLLIFDVKKF